MAKSTKWMDRLAVLFSLGIVGLSVWWMGRTGVFNFTLHKDSQLTWHLIRSSGIIAYVLLLGSMVWGLFISGQFVKDWSPGPVSLTLHSTVSWLALVLGLVHASLLLVDSYFQYTLADIFVPFVGPYRPQWVGMGTLGFWLLLIVTLSFPIRKRIGHRPWKYLHYTSYAAFGLVTMHGLFAGTDGGHIGLQMTVGIGMLVVTLLLAYRLRRSLSKAKAPARSAVRRPMPVPKANR